MNLRAFTVAGVCLAAALAGACGSGNEEALAQNCQGAAQQQCLIVALRDCRLATSAKQDEFNACEPYKKCSDTEFQKCIEEER